MAHLWFNKATAVRCSSDRWFHSLIVLFSCLFISPFGWADESTSGQTRSIWSQLPSIFRHWCCHNKHEQQSWCAGRRHKAAAHASSTRWAPRRCECQLLTQNRDRKCTHDMPVDPWGGKYHVSCVSGKSESEVRLESMLNHMWFCSLI